MRTIVIGVPGFVDPSMGASGMYKGRHRWQSKRLVPLTADLTALLKDLYKVRYLHEPHVFLVGRKSVQSIKTAFNAACRRSGINEFQIPQVLADASQLRSSQGEVEV